MTTMAFLTDYRRFVTRSRPAWLRPVLLKQVPGGPHAPGAAGAARISCMVLSSGFRNVLASMSGAGGNEFETAALLPAAPGRQGITDRRPSTCVNSHAE